ncbi:MAG: transcriptional regulator GutM [Treponema sp.]|jgi:glucitol operon activator protein|nr:transcriptional regulator GutM [Treponema sp.]
MMETILAASGGGRSTVFLVIFALLSLQMIMGLLQFRQYQRAVKKWLGKGILGIGQRRGVLQPGELLILVYNREEDRVVSVQSMRGYTIFARFGEAGAYTGLSLEELRRIGIEKDAVEMRWRRRRHPYDPAELTKKKGALIQAVEAVDRYLKRQAEKAEEGAERKGA